MKKRFRTSVPSDPEAWSPQSKNSFSYYGGRSTEYRDIEYRCWCCGKDAVFTAEQQKRAFEVRKRHVWERRSLCGDCHLTRVEMEREVKALSERWVSDRAAMKAAREALARWKELLELLPRYGAPRNTARLAMLTKLLADEA